MAGFLRRRNMTVRRIAALPTYAFVRPNFQLPPFSDLRARQALAAIHFPAEELGRSGRLVASYHADGTPAADYEATSIYAGVIPGLLVSGQTDLANQVFTEHILRSYVSTADGAWWGFNHDNYYDQNIAWFTAALMNGALSNLWADQTTIDWDEVLYDGR